MWTSRYKEEVRCGLLIRHGVYGWYLQWTLIFSTIGFGGPALKAPEIGWVRLCLRYEQRADQDSRSKL